MHHEGQQHTGACRARPPNGSARAQLCQAVSSWRGWTARDTPRGSLTGGVSLLLQDRHVAAGPDGSLFAAWRHVYPGNVRDIAFTVSRDGGRTFAASAPRQRRPVGRDGLPGETAAPAMAVDGRNRRAHGVAERS